MATRFSISTDAIKTLAEKVADAVSEWLSDEVDEAVVTEPVRPQTVRDNMVDALCAIIDKYETNGLYGVDHEHVADEVIDAILSKLSEWDRQQAERILARTA